MRNRHHLPPDPFITLMIITNKDPLSPETPPVIIVEIADILLNTAESNKRIIEETLPTDNPPEETPDQTITLVTDLIPDTEADLEINIDLTIIIATSMIDPEAAVNHEIDINQAIDALTPLTDLIDPKVNHQHPTPEKLTP